MSTNGFSLQNVPIEQPLNTKDLIEVLIKHYDLHDGKYELLLEFQIGIGSFGPSQENQAPGASISISKFGLIKAQSESSPSAVNAAVVNPPKKSKTK